MQTSGQSILKINLAALVRNWNKFKNLGAPITSAVIKANAYGIGAKECAISLQEAGCTNFFVAHLEEAIEARKFISANCRIFVLNGIFDQQSDLFLEFDLIPILNSIEQFDLFQNKIANHKYGLHIDTGMNRLGIRYDDFDDIFKIKASKNQPILIMSHLASASNRDALQNTIQNARFQTLKSHFDKCDFSLSASAGSLLGQDFLYDLIRPGIGLYGGNPMDNEANLFEPLVQILSPIIQIRKVKKDETIGYGASFKAQKDIEIGILPIGYADGIIRAIGNCGKAFINGQITNILGRISMDLIAIDLENIKSAKLGDFVEIYGPNIKIDDQANCANTISYELLTRLGSRFKKIYHHD
ncbi:MAG: alanine racemase [Caulobacterales bacterium]|nr:alanine racemase [Caulobacterales bacterium]